MSPETCRVDLKKLIKEKLLHLVGCLHHCTGDVRSHRRQLSKIDFLRCRQVYWKPAVDLNELARIWKKMTLA